MKSKFGDTAFPRVAVVMAAKDERMVIAKTLEKLLAVFVSGDVYVVDDGSTDGTGEIARGFGVRVFTNNPRSKGKVLSLKRAVDEGKLPERYDAVMFVDADTRVDSGFLDYVRPKLEDEEVGVVVGQVKTSFMDNVFVAYRDYVYTLWQQVWKRVGNLINGVVIAPGTASVYKVEVLRRLEFDKELIIEDFDLTFQVHRKKLGKIVYVPEAVVYTQDPDNLRDYYRQVVRWNLGMLQAMVKHRVPWGFAPFEIMIWWLLGQAVVRAGLLLLLPAYLLVLSAKLWGWAVLPLGVDRYFSLFAVGDFFLVAGVAGLLMVRRRKKVCWNFLLLFWVVELVNVVAFLEAVRRLLVAPRTSRWVSPRRRG